MHQNFYGRQPITVKESFPALQPPNSTPPSGTPVEQTDTEEYCEGICATVEDEQEEILCGSDGYMYTSEAQLECYASCLHIGECVCVSRVSRVSRVSQVRHWSDVGFSQPKQTDCFNSFDRARLCSECIISMQMSFHLLRIQLFQLFRVFFLYFVVFFSNSFCCSSVCNWSFCGF